MFVNTAELWAPLHDARQAVQQCRGSMAWHTVGGRDYLKRKQGRSQRSLGPRSAATQATYDAFRAAKTRAGERHRALALQAAVQARFARAAALNRVPMEVAGLCRLLVDRTHWRIIGTNALYAYEARAGVRITSGAEATQDTDVLWDTRGGKRAALVSPELDPGGFIGLLQKIDRTFERVERQPFRAVNARGFMVDLLRPFATSELIDIEARASSLPSDLLAQPIRGLEWLVSSPMMQQLAIDARGFALRMTVPDPRAFALHKLWLSGRSDREPVKRVRDRHQAELVGRLLVEHLPEFPLDEAALRQFPAAVREAGLANLPVGL